jgi:hypothetical protein
VAVTYKWVENVADARKDLQRVIKELRDLLVKKAELDSFMANWTERLEPTDSAIVMLLLPLVDIVEDRSQLGSRFSDVSDAELQATLNTLLRTMGSDPARADEVYSAATQKSHRSALSVIKAYWRRFCNIPPFCGER